MSGTMKIEASVDGKNWAEIDGECADGCGHGHYRMTTPWIDLRRWPNRLASVNPYFEETPEMRELRERLAELMKQIAVPRFFIPAEAGDAIARAMDADYKRMASTIGIGAISPYERKDERPCYRCDARADVTGAVPLCARCRAET